MDRKGKDNVMRRFITSAALALSLLGTAGFADARGFDRPREAGHGPVVIRERGAIHYRDFGHRPAPYAERFGFRAGYHWHPGAWSWNGYEWIWLPSYYFRVAL
jgi:hypothetical protein